MKLARRLFFWGAVLFALGGVIHFPGHLAGKGQPANPVESLMQSHRPGGWRFSIWDIHEAFIAWFGFLMVWIGTSGALFGRSFGESSELLRTASLFYAIAAAGIAAIAAAYAIFPITLLVTPSLILFIAAFFATPRAT